MADIDFCVLSCSYESLQIVHTARRLYQRSGVEGKEKQDLLRRFAAGYKILMTTGDPPAA
jgi:hypothetical protein